MGAVSVSEELAAICSAAARRVSAPDLAERLNSEARNLREPLRLAIGGSVSAGKSTLVNGLLGRRVAPVEAGECTRVVTWYQHGPDGEIDIQLRDGTHVCGSIDADGRVPEQLGVPIASVQRLVVSLDEPVLRDLVLIDTPGINTVSELTETAARELLFGETTGASAQALLYVMRHLQVPDAAAVSEFRELFGKCGLTAVNAVAVLTQVDRRADAQQMWPTARRLADSARRALTGMVLDVVPVVGLLAEAARAQLLAGDDVAALRQLAELDDEVLDELLADVDDYLDPALPGPPIPQRRRLLALLHFYGQRVTIAALRSDPSLRARELDRVLEAAAGLRPPGAEEATFHGEAPRPSEAGAFSLDDVMAHFVRRADALKAFAALGNVRRICHGTATDSDRAVLTALLDELDEGRAVPAKLSGLRVLVALEAVSRGELQLDAQLTDDLYRLVRGATAAEQLGLATDADPRLVVRQARDMSIRWRGFAGQLGSSMAGCRVADVLAVIEELAHVPERPEQLPQETAAILHDLRTGETPTQLVGLPSAAPREQVAAAAAVRAARLRLLANAATDRFQRQELLAGCGQLEQLWADMTDPANVSGQR